MDRLGYPYKAGKQCDSCPNSCEEATGKQGNVMEDFKQIASILEKDGRLPFNSIEEMPSDNKIVCQKMHLKWEKVFWVTYVFNTIFI